MRGALERKEEELSHDRGGARRREGVGDGERERVERGGRALRGDGGCEDAGAGLDGVHGHLHLYEVRRDRQDGDGARGSAADNYHWGGRRGVSGRGEDEGGLGGPNGVEGRQDALQDLLARGGRRLGRGWGRRARRGRRGGLLDRKSVV